MVALGRFLVQLTFLCSRPGGFLRPAAAWVVTETLSCCKCQRPGNTAASAAISRRRSHYLRCLRLRVAESASFHSLASFTPKPRFMCSILSNLERRGRQEMLQELRYRDHKEVQTFRSASENRLVITGIRTAKPGCSIASPAAYLSRCKFGNRADNNELRQSAPQMKRCNQGHQRL